MLKKIMIDEIRTDGGTQIRAQLDWVAQDEYANAMREGSTFPPVTVFFDGDSYWLADGFHRVGAALLAEIDSLDVEVRQGSVADAAIYACGANIDHGIRRTNEDKRNAVKWLLDHNVQNACGWSNREIARRAGVSLNLVNTMVSELKVQIDTPRTVTRGGVTYQMDTSGIGATQEGQPDRAVEFEDLAGWHQNDRLAPSHDPAPISNSMEVHYSSKSPEHYTPSEIIDLVVDVMGDIDLDPCSNSHDDPNVPAAKVYTASDDGLLQDWSGRVYMNPPYGREIEGWVEKLATSYDQGEVSEAIALLPARTDTQWWGHIEHQMFCLIVGRLKFIGNGDPAPFPSVAFYLGKNGDNFYRVFSKIGRVCLMVDEGRFPE